MAEPRVSVVIPCYNGGADLPGAIESVRGQTMADFEILVVDDGSTDPETVRVLADLDSKLRVIRQDNRGLPAARNAGFKAARGAFLLPLDCDDRLEPTFLAETLAALERAPDAGFAFAQMRLTGDLAGTTRKAYDPFVQLFLNQLPYCLLMRRALWAMSGGYDESMRAGYEDWEFNIRLAALGHRGVAIDKPLFVYRTSAAGMLNSLSRRRHAELWRMIQLRHPDRYRWGALWRLWRASRFPPLPYPAPLLVGLWLAHRLLPDPAFNALYARLLAFSASRRAGGC
jgi:glycosyltransferase involved in cell wall biosynthesis